MPRYFRKFFTPGSLFYVEGKFYKYYSNPEILNKHNNACSFCGVYNSFGIKVCPLLFSSKTFKNNICSYDGYFIQYFPEKFSVEKLLYTMYYYVSTAYFFRRHSIIQSYLSIYIRKLMIIYSKCTRRLLHAKKIY